jgi:hypothetical protein
VEEHGGRYRVALAALDGGTHVRVEASVAADLPSGSVFGSLAEASRFFRQGAIGWSPTARPGVYDGVEMRDLPSRWRARGRVAVDSAAR